MDEKSWLTASPRLHIRFFAMLKSQLLRRRVAFSSGSTNLNQNKGIPRLIELARRLHSVKGKGFARLSPPLTSLRRRSDIRHKRIRQVNLVVSSLFLLFCFDSPRIPQEHTFPFCERLKQIPVKNFFLFFC